MAVAVRDATQFRSSAGVARLAIVGGMTEGRHDCFQDDDCRLRYSRTKKSAFT